MRQTLSNYEIVVKNKLMDTLNEEISRVYTHKDIFVVTDHNVFKLYETFLKDKLKDYDVHFVSVDPGEHSKSLATYTQVVTKLLNLGMRKNHLLIALGGGVIGDLAGFVAATLFRGVPLIQIPTTLLAMVDASIGGKTGLDLNEGKNLIGAFKNPLKVLIDPIFLETLPKIEYKNGLAEVLKAGIIGDPSLYEYLKTQDKLTLKELKQAIEVKVKIVKKDPFEQNERMFLNFGHTFGHAIERHYDYAIKHGVAISYGMLMSLELGIKAKITPAKLFDDIKAILVRLELVKEPLLDKKQFIQYIGFDKKNLADGLRFVYIKNIGEPVIKKGVEL